MRIAYIEGQARRYGARPFRVYLVHMDWLLWVLTIAIIAVTVTIAPVWWTWLGSAFLVVFDCMSAKAAHRAWRALQGLLVTMLLHDFTAPGDPW